MVNMRHAFILNLLLISIISACNVAPRSTTEPVSNEQSAVITTSAETSSVYVRGKDDASHFCAAVPPDATFTEQESGIASISLLNFGGGSPEDGSIAEETSGDEMMGRTPALLASREILYRTCELMGNLDLSKDQALEIYNKSLNTVAEIMGSETENTAISLSAGFTDASANSSGTTLVQPPVLPSHRSMENQSYVPDSSTASSSLTPAADVTTTQQPSQSQTQANKIPNTANDTETKQTTNSDDTKSLW